MRLLLSLLLSALFFSCNNTDTGLVSKSPNGDRDASKARTVALVADATAFTKPDKDKWAAYWYQGKAEITSFELDQGRYGQGRKGDAVLVFVTEPFSKDKQVKLDNPNLAGNDKQSILKCNATRKFLTGVYPYSTMQSVFTPVNEQPSMKLTTSVQEWCGQVFMQVNEKRKNYEVKHFSYFESEGDQEFNVDKVLLEDEIFNRIRINPSSLPQGTFRLLPNTVFIRFLHLPYTAVKANAKLMTEGSTSKYIVEIPELKRTLEVEFESSFPHEILGWKETYPNSWSGGQITTTAKRKKTIKLDYWSHNGNNDLRYRDSLGLPR